MMGPQKEVLCNRLDPHTGSQTMTIVSPHGKKVTDVLKTVVSEP